MDGGEMDDGWMGRCMDHQLKEGKVLEDKGKEYSFGNVEFVGVTG